MSKKYSPRKPQEQRWAVVLTLLLRDDKQEEGATPAPVLRDYVAGVRAKNAEGAALRAMTMIWTEASSRKEIMPVCGCRALPWHVYADMIKTGAEQSPEPVDDAAGQKTGPEKEKEDGLPAV